MALLTNVAIKVFEKSRGDDAAAICKSLNLFHKMNDVRKRVAHGLWVPFKEGGTVHYTSRSKLAPAHFTEQAQHLEQLSDELSQLRADFENEAFNVLNLKRQPK